MLPQGRRCDGCLVSQLLCKTERLGGFVQSNDSAFNAGCPISPAGGGVVGPNLRGPRVHRSGDFWNCHIWRRRIAPS
jgi:hypothetical protein